MKSVLTFIALATLVAGCDLVVVVSTGPTPVNPNIVVTTGGRLVIGTATSGALTRDHGEMHYQVVPPRDGTLVVHVRWEQSLGVVAMWIGDTPFTCPNRVPPIVGRMPVKGGQSYSVRVMDGAPSHSGALDLPFELMANME